MCCGNFEFFCCLCDLLQEFIQYQEMVKFCRLLYLVRMCRGIQVYGRLFYLVVYVLDEIIYVIFRVVVYFCFLF